MDLNAKNSLHVYQFDFPTDLCGQLIGRHGHNIRQIKEISGASIIIRRKSCTADYQIVILEGMLSFLFVAYLKKSLPITFLLFVILVSFISA